jgi:hypothetical protein
VDLPSACARVLVSLAAALLDQVYDAAEFLLSQLLQPLVEPVLF